MTYSSGQNHGKALFYGLLATLFVVALLGSRPAYVSGKFDRPLYRCAKANGLDTVPWKVMNGFHDLNIGRQFVAGTAEERATIACTIREAGSIIERGSPTNDSNQPTLTVWYGETIFSTDIVTYNPPLP